MPAQVLSGKEVSQGGCNLISSDFLLNTGTGTFIPRSFFYNLHYEDEPKRFFFAVPACKFVFWLKCNHYRV